MAVKTSRHEVICIMYFLRLIFFRVLQNGKDQSREVTFWVSESPQTLFQVIVQAADHPKC